MNKKDILHELQKRNKELYSIVFVGFNTSEELDAYRKTIQPEIDEYYENLEKIKTLEWELMTPEEQSKKLELRRKIIEKNEKLSKKN